MKEPIWVQLQVVRVVHDQVLLDHGGSVGLRDQRLLESALARPQQLFSYGEADIYDLATAYVGGLVRNHPFVDGNKRVGFMVGYVFLARNGLMLEASEAETAQAVLDLTASRISEEEFAAWLRARCRRATPRR